MPARRSSSVLVVPAAPSSPASPLALAAPGARGTARPPSRRGVAAIEAAAGGRLGVAVVDRRRAAARPACRRAVCDVLDLQGARRRGGAEARRRGRRAARPPVAYGPADLLDYAPMPKALSAEGAMSLAV